jgi:hypothetical protein
LSVVACHWPCWPLCSPLRQHRRRQRRHRLRSEPGPRRADFAIAYTKGPLFDKNNKVQQRADLRDPRRFNVGTDLFVRDRASPSAVERNVTIGQTKGTGDVMGVQISQDGKRVLFAMRGPFDPTKNMDNQPTWAIWEYEIATDTLHRLIAADITAAAGTTCRRTTCPTAASSSRRTRQRQAKAILLDEGKPQFDAQDEDGRQTTYVLHVMDADGSNLHQCRSTRATISVRQCSTAAEFCSAAGTMRAR